MSTVTVRVDASDWRGTLPHAWTYIGYDECNYTTTPEGGALLGEIGRFQEQPYYVRCHHLLCTGNGLGSFKWGSTNVYLEDEDGTPRYDWTGIDGILDAILRSGCKPFVELGFMPRDLADPRLYDKAHDGHRMEQYQRTGWACPPKDYARWHDLIRALVAHCVARHGAAEVATWYWELWNEPDLDYYWKGTTEEFCTLYDYTVAAVKAALPEARVGGPATTNPVAGGRAAGFLDDFLAHVTGGVNAVTGERGTTLDFVSFHVKGGGYRADPLHRPQRPPSVRRVLELAATGYEILSRYEGLTALECVLSEADPDGWAGGGAWDNINLNFRNTEYYPSYVACAFDKLLAYARERDWDLKLLTWAFLFVGERCFEGTRALATQGIDKPILNLFRAYARLGAQQVALSSSGAQDPLAYGDQWGMEAPPDVSGIATLSGDTGLQVLLYCHHDDWNRKDKVAVTLEIANLPYPAESLTLRHYRIDDAHSNAYSEWVRQGRPLYPAPGQKAAIMARQGLELAEAPRVVPVEDGPVRLAFTMPTHAVSLIEVERER